MGSESSGQWLAKANRNSRADSKKAQAVGISCTGSRTARQQWASCSTTPTQTEKLKQKSYFNTKSLTTYCYALII